MTEHKLRLTAVSVLLLAVLQFALPGDRGVVAQAQSQGKANSEMTMSNVEESPLACNATALNAAQRLRIRTLLNLLHSSQQEFRELPSGYAVRLPGEASIIYDVAEHITLERLCCPFFDLSLASDRAGGPASVTPTGAALVTQFARTGVAL